MVPRALQNLQLAPNAVKKIIITPNPNSANAVAPSRHNEHHFVSSDMVRDIVIGLADGLTVPFALAAGLAGTISASHLVVVAGLKARGPSKTKKGRPSRTALPLSAADPLKADTHKRVAQFAAQIPSELRIQVAASRRE